MALNVKINRCLNDMRLGTFISDLPSVEDLGFTACKLSLSVNLKQLQLLIFK